MDMCEWCFSLKRWALAVCPLLGHWSMPAAQQPAAVLITLHQKHCFFTVTTTSISATTAVCLRPAYCVFARAYCVFARTHRAHLFVRTQIVADQPAKHVSSMVWVHFCISAHL